MNRLQHQCYVLISDFRYDVDRDGNDVRLIVEGNGFLYNMVRIIAGTLIDVGHGKLPPDCLENALHTHDRLDLGVTAPACGLELTEVRYPVEAIKIRP